MPKQPTAQYRIVSKIFETDKDYPAVVHVFYGKTLVEASRYQMAHMGADIFYRGCTIDKTFRGFKCRNEQHSERWDGQRWVPA